MTDSNSIKPSNYAWWIFILSAAFLFYKYILQISPAVMTKDLMQAYSLTGTGLGFLVGFYFYTYLIMQIPSGILLDRYGTKRITSLAILLCACGALLFSQTHSFVLACFGRLLIGFGAAFATTSYMKLTSVWFPKHYFALFVGFFGTACMTGAGTAGLPLAWLVHLTSWRVTLLYCSLIGFALFVIFYFSVKHRKIAESQISTVETFHWGDLWSLCRNKSNWPLILYGGLAFTPAAVFGGLWGVPYLMTTYHLSPAAAASSASLTFFGFAAGGLGVGWLGKQSQSLLRIMTIGSVLALGCFSLVLYGPSVPVFVLRVEIFLFGFFSSGFLLSYAVARNINSVALVGTVIGLINMGDPLCGALAEPLIGKILDLNWDGMMINQVREFSVHAYQLGLSVLVIYLFLAVVCCYFIKEKPCVTESKRESVFVD